MPRRRASSNALAVSAFALASITFGACSDGSAQSPSGDLAAYLIPTEQVGSGLATRIDTPMSLAGVARATPLSADLLSPFLETHGFRDAYARVLSKGSDSVTLIVLEFGSAPQATAMVAFESTNLTSSANTFVTPHQDIPGSFVYVIGGPNKTKSATLLCDGVWFAGGAHAFEYATAHETYFGSIDGQSVQDLIPETSAPAAESIIRYLGGERHPGMQRKLTEVSLLAPIARPGKIICIGLNYLNHIRETGESPPAAPVVFSKFNNAVVGPRDPIRYSDRNTTQVDWEAELVVVIGRTCRAVPVSEALEHVFGYTVGNDVSARDAQFQNGQWTRGKTFDTFLPLGPWIVTAEELHHPQSLGIQAWVGEELMQDGNTKDMIFPVAELVSYLSQTITLEPGDIIMTGTPWGVGFVRKPPRFLGDGDVVRIVIESIGELSNPVVVTPRAGR